MKQCLASILVCLCFSGTLLAQGKEDHEGVKAAVLDYVEGIYQVQPERIERSVHPSLRKHGFYVKDGKYVEVPMTYEQLVKLAGTYNSKGKIPKDAPKEVTVLDVMDKTASAKLIADWGMDYFHLAKYDGKWMITNVIWQSLPKSD